MPCVVCRVPCAMRRVPCCSAFSYIFMEDDVSYWEPLKKFYQVDDSFPAEQLLTRSDGEKKRNIYFVSDYVKQILANNDSEAVRVINAGVKIFMRSDQKKVGGLTRWQACSCWREVRSLSRVFTGVAASSAALPRRCYGARLHHCLSPR